MAKWWWLGGSVARWNRWTCVSPMPSHCTGIPKFGVGIGCAPKSSRYQTTDASRSGAWTLTWLTRMAVMASRQYRPTRGVPTATAGCKPPHRRVRPQTARERARARNGLQADRRRHSALRSRRAARTGLRDLAARSAAIPLRPAGGPPEASHPHRPRSEVGGHSPATGGRPRVAFQPPRAPRAQRTMSSHLHAVSADHVRPAGAAPDVVTAPLLDLVPAVADALTPVVAEQVGAGVVVRVWSLPRGSWPAATHTEHGLMGLLVVDGVLARCMGFGKAAYPELVGHGDLVRPWDAEPAGHLGRLDVTWQVLEPCRVAVLDRRFAGIVGRWPEIVDQLLSRAMSRASALDFSMAIAQLPLLEARLLAMLWHLADRWGVTVDGGMHVPIRLTHSLLASMVLARRPSVSTALAELDRRGIVSRSGEGWLLRGAPPTELD